VADVQCLFDSENAISLELLAGIVQPASAGLVFASLSAAREEGKTFAAFLQQLCAISLSLDLGLKTLAELLQSSTLNFPPQVIVASDLQRVLLNIKGVDTKQIHPLYAPNQRLHIELLRKAVCTKGAEQDPSAILITFGSMRRRAEQTLEVIAKNGKLQDCNTAASVLAAYQETVSVGHLDVLASLAFREPLFFQEHSLADITVEVLLSYAGAHFSFTPDSLQRGGMSFGPTSVGLVIMDDKLRSLTALNMNADGRVRGGGFLCAEAVCKSTGRKLAHIRVGEDSVVEASLEEAGIKRYIVNFKEPGGWVRGA
jgi:hypothetical protein